MNNKVILDYIGFIHTPFTKKSGIPIQSCYSEAEGWIELFPEFTDGLKDLSGFSHIILLYHFHLVEEYKLTVKPYLEEKSHGVFATRAPTRPNPIGFSTVELMEINGEKSILKIRGVDMVDETPLIDIKPYVPHFDNRIAKVGWLSKTSHTINKKKISDTRF